MYLDAINILVDILVRHAAAQQVGPAERSEAFDGAQSR